MPFRLTPQFSRLTAVHGVTLIFALLAAAAQAQLRETVTTTAAQPLLKGFVFSGNRGTKGATTLTLDMAGGRVAGVLIEAPLPAAGDVARGIAAAWGSSAQGAERLAQMLAKPAFQAQARQGFVDLSDDNGTDLLAVKLLGQGRESRWRVYSALNFLPEKAFPPTQNTTGSASAPDRIHLLSDFQCPACLQLWQEVVPGWRSKPEQYRLSFHHFPLHYHKNAFAAAEAGECAARQGKFWPYADALYGHFTDWTPELPAIAARRFGQYAASLNLNDAAFKSCLNTHAARPEVTRQQQAGDRVFLTGTPTVYLNGLKLSEYTQAETQAVQALTHAKPSGAEVVARRLKTF